MKVVQEIIAYFDKKGDLSSRELIRILDKNAVASDVPSSMNDIPEMPGAMFYFRVTGRLEGQVWGTDIYTRDSVVGAAAVHAGLLQPGETKVLRLKVVPAQDSYPGTTRNGVTTSDYSLYPICWQLSHL